LGDQRISIFISSEEAVKKEFVFTVRQLIQKKSAGFFFCFLLFCAALSFTPPFVFVLDPLPFTPR